MPDLCVSKKGKTLTPLTRKALLGVETVGAANEDGHSQGGREQGGEAGLVRVEANFLRLPLFALDNKHLRTMDGIRCSGTFRRHGQSYQFSFTATRNARSLYPGPLARSAHFALLSLATERGLPVVNPIVFSWHELCARMEIQCSGKTVRELRAALMATKGLMIESNHALFLEPVGKPLDSREEQGQVVALYDELEFFGVRKADGERADINAVWLSRWYLDNLNALYSAPLDYTLWRRLNEKSFIASRLYEFLFLKFFAGQDVLRFNYPNLVKFIPARMERYASDAKKQLQPPLDLLCAHGLLGEVRWQQSRGGVPQISFTRGARLTTASSPGPAADVGEEDFVLQQLENVRLPEWLLVEEYHRLWEHANYRPSRAELASARELLQEYGREGLRAALPAVVRQMRQEWPAAKTFVAAVRYLNDACRTQQRRAEMRQQEQQAPEQKQDDEQRSAEQVRDLAVLRQSWEGLPEVEREAIRQRVLSSQPLSLRKFPALVERFCLDELKRSEERNVEKMSLEG